MKKNPSPQFFRELSNLKNREVSVQIRSNTALFLITGILKQFGQLFVIESHEIDKTVHFSSSVMFKSNFVKQIINNENKYNLYNQNYIPTIILKNNDNNKSTNYMLTKEELLNFVKDKKLIKIEINRWSSIFRDIIGMEPYVYGRLKYYKNDDKFYIISPNTKIQTYFKFENIEGNYKDITLDLYI